MKAREQQGRNWLLIMVAAALVLVPALAAAEEVSAYGNPVQPVTIGRVTVQAEMVQSPAKLFLGLSYRNGLPEGRGMLFVLPDLAVQVFCMRGMRFPLDILWLTAGKVVGIGKNISPIYQGELTSPAPVNFVLEVPGGFCDRHGIRVGDAAAF